MKTLIIHPDDRTTDFLCGIYATLPEYTLVINGTKAHVNSLIDAHDRIIMCGHGTPMGLLSVKQFDSFEYIIDSYTVPRIRGKECIYIWCNADKFVQAHSLKGLYSGMFVSEVNESILMGIGFVRQKVVDQSNDCFANNMGSSIMMSLSEIYERVLHNYGLLAKTNIIAKYNARRLFLDI
jgi:hypothetical protein